MSTDAIAILNLFSQQYGKTWEIYIMFYTAFLLGNLTALGLFAEKLKRRRTGIIVSVAFCIQNFLALVSALAMARYSYQVGQDVAPLLALSELQARPFATTLGVWGGMANASAHLAFIAMFIFLVARDREAKPPT